MKNLKLLGLEAVLFLEKISFSNRILRLFLKFFIILLDKYYV